MAGMKRCVWWLQQASRPPPTTTQRKSKIDTKIETHPNRTQNATYSDYCTNFQCKCPRIRSSVHISHKKVHESCLSTEFIKNNNHTFNCLHDVILKQLKRCDIQRGHPLIALQSTRTPSRICLQWCGRVGLCVPDRCSTVPLRAGPSLRRSRILTDTLLSKVWAECEGHLWAWRSNAGPQTQ